MRLIVNSAALAVIGTATSSSAFLLPWSAASSRIGRSTVVKSSQGWDNEGFLEALGGGSDAIQKANDDYGARVEKREAQEDRLRRQQAGAGPQAVGAGSPGDEVEDEDDGGQGGSRFREMLKASQSASVKTGSLPRPIENPFLTPPPPTEPVVPSLGNLGELSVEEQAKMFRLLMENQGGAALPPRTAPVKREDRAGRPVGRNRDADSIANASDLYFAQLKRDSSVRTLARYQGDPETADAVFQDEGISALKDLLQKNPYLKDQNERERNMFDTIPEEAIAPYMEPREKPEETTSSGISYKEKLAQKRKLATGKPAASSQAPGSQMQSNLPSYTETAQPAVQEKSPLQSAPSPTEARSVAVEPAGSPRAATSIQVELEDTSIDSTNPEDVRQKIRTLMGMTLKHRGGPGFGSGRLKGKEVEGFESLLEEATRMLRSEATQHVTTSATSPMAQSTSPQPSSFPPAHSVSSSPSPLQTPSSGQSQESDIDKMISCIEGATLMYKNSPPELRESVLGTLRAALAAALETSDRVLGSNGQVQAIPPVAPPQPPAQQQPMAAVSTPAPAAATPSVPSSADTSLQVQTATDPNSAALEEILKQIKNASGDGKLGLRSDLSSSEAARLREKLVDMRSILMGELDTGIPDTESAKPASAPTPSGGSDDGGSSKYQQMLAKARAAKA